MGFLKWIAIIWVIAIAGCFVIKKIQPESFKLYVVYVIIVCILFTVCQVAFR